MYPFRTGSNFYVTSIWHTFYFSDEYNSYALPLEETDGIPDAGMKPNINYYPNPARHYVTFYVTDPGEYNVKMYTASGQLLFEKPLTKENTLDIQDLSPGFYYVELLNHGAPVMKNKLVKTD